MTTSTSPTTDPTGFTEQEWDAGHSWSDNLDSLTTKQDLWASNDRRAGVHADEAARLADLPGPRRVLVLTEDWCGDAIRSVPVIAAASRLTSDLEVRYLAVDDHPETLDRNLTHGGRAIPLAIVQDEGGRHLGTWGPRPAPLQALLRARKRELGPPSAETMGEFYAPIMSWYAGDKGRTTLQELLMLLERGGAPR